VFERRGFEVFSLRQEELRMSEADLRPPVWVGHVLLETDRLPETAAFMRKLGLRPVVERAEFAVLELRGGTHLVLLAKPRIESAVVEAREAAFDLMVEDLHATHAAFVKLGLEPTPIERMSREHECFKLREPSGHLITIVSNHTTGQPV
jgi:catechol 2,3-dioxygenase-like lactoylglutathione lyase family enzyme